MRKRSPRVVRLEIEKGMSAWVRELLVRELELHDSQVYPVKGPLDLQGLWALYALDRPDLKEEPYSGVTPPHRHLLCAAPGRRARPPSLRVVRGLGGGVRRPGGGRPDGPRHQADPVPD